MEAGKIFEESTNRLNSTANTITVSTLFSIPAADPGKIILV